MNKTKKTVNIECNTGSSCEEDNAVCVVITLTEKQPEEAPQSFCSMITLLYIQFK